MKKLNPGQIKIRNTGYILLLTGLCWLAFSALFASKFHTGISISQPLFFIIISLFLMRGGYLAARRVAFLMSATLTLNFFLFLIFTACTFYQINLDQIKIFLAHQSTFLPYAAYLLATVLVQLCAYVRLTNKKIKGGMVDANVPYRPFWRYGSARGALIVMAFFIVNVYLTAPKPSLVNEILKFANAKIQKKYGPSAFFIARTIEFKKDPKLISYQFRGEVYDGKTFVPINVHLKGENKSGGSSTSEFIFDIGW